MSTYHVEANAYALKLYLNEAAPVPPIVRRDVPDFGRVRAFHRCSTSEGSIAVCLTAGIDFPEKGNRA